MSPESIFTISSSIATVGWIILVFVTPFWNKTDKFLVGIIITLFCIVYVWFIVHSVSPSDLKGFGSLEGVMTLFQDKTLLTAGWVHYLAIDLFLGLWITKNAKRHGINHWMLLPVFVITFMFAPIGLLIYLLIRWFKTRRYFAEN